MILLDLSVRDPVLVSDLPGLSMPLLASLDWSPISDSHSPTSLGPSDGQFFPRLAVIPLPFSNHDTDFHPWDRIWHRIRDLLGCSSLRLLRAYVREDAFGWDRPGAPFSPFPEALTVVVALHSLWLSDWSGETALVEPPDQIVRSVLPIPGHVFIFHSSTPCTVRPISRLCPFPRRVLIFECGPWPAERPLIGTLPDRFTSVPGPTPQPWARIGDLNGSLRLTGAVEWLRRTSAAWTPCPSGSTLALHLLAVAHWLSAWNAPEVTVLAGLAYRLFDSPDSNPLSAPVLSFPRDRMVADRVFTPDAIRLALRFSCVDRAELDALAMRISSFISDSFPVSIARRAGAVEGPEHGPLVVDPEELQAFLWLSAADRLTTLSDPLDIALEAPSLIHPPGTIASDPVTSTESQRPLVPVSDPLHHSSSEDAS